MYTFMTMGCVYFLLIFSNIQVGTFFILPDEGYNLSYWIMRSCVMTVKCRKILNMYFFNGRYGFIFLARPILGTLA